jgi:membrane fusion protein, heavy metal efflux system
VHLDGEGFTKMRFFSILAIAAFAALLPAFALTASLAHEGEDHDTPPVQVAIGVIPRAEAASEEFELVAIANRGELTIYLDRLRTNDPIINAAITVETPAGSVVASPEHDGTYKLAAPWAIKPGRYGLIFTVDFDDTTDVLTATLEVPDAAPLPRSTSTGTNDGLLSQLRQRIEGRDPLLILTSVVGFALGLVVMGLLARRKFVPAVALLAILAAALTTAALAHEGEDHGEAVVNAAMPSDGNIAKRLADGALFVPKPTQRLLAIRTDVTTSALHRRTIELPGRIIPDPNASGYVQASAGGRLSAPTGGFPRLGTRVNKGDVLAFVTPPLQAIDMSDMRQRQGELDQQISIVERRIARYETLVQRGAVTQVQLDESRLELQGLKDRRSALDRARVEPEALVAPVSGIVAEMTAIAGQMAQTNTVLFQIIEPTRLWIEALSFDTLTGTQSAVAKTSGGRSLALAYQGTGFADRNQAIPVQFKIEDDTGGLRAGQFVTVLAATSDEREGIAVPRASVVRTQTGQDLAFEHMSAERFVPRSVRIEPLDGEHVLIVAGLTAGARIVTQGTELLDQVR